MKTIKEVELEEKNKELKQRIDFLIDKNDEKQRVLDKIKEKLNILNEEPYNATIYIMVITEIYKLLEEKDV